jgi:hypothetical protein
MRSEFLALMPLMHLRPFKSLSLELAKCVHKDTTTKILQTASELPYCADREKNMFSMLPNGAHLKVHVSRVQQQQPLAQIYTLGD